MTEGKAVALVFDTSDKAFFTAHPERKAHIRLPYKGEAEGEFWQLGEHNRARRRILLCRCDAIGNPLPNGQIAKLPFLAFADESIEDTDEVLLPIIDEIMRDAFKGEMK